ncbi:Integrase catalytic subunit (plasmid) [Cupriavidus taiwanensis]|uniref:Integrase catalytic subunit n=3 Tax=Cupriavidus TaxID=106589 RepID=A0A375HEU2_9BURK|nr:integrase core domain-containing protein [Cupriavidus taiwanensis]SOZ70945.1 Integrase catalytic subunit [Cupriavidus taiwanensis]SOZ72133.1 Integrase catalytic subunit [Cupriavidus taiwanensis]SOZ74430.1 Integrase catalytic subunit [Cupriavidus taiwanensis]SPA03335.1 Integrase catalytic subunit [Cupriavidus taiwanensis]SPA57278.1 Integrase catalytic subunit [Cupriavidus taiwanensis]
MPWSELTPMEQRLLFVIDQLQRRDSVSALCERYGISRKTGYKWIERYANEGLNGLNEGSRCRHDQERIAYPIRQAVLQLRGHGGTELGPKKIQKRLAERFGEAEVPSRTTIYNILKAAGRIEPRHKRRRVARYGTPLRSAREPNGLWSADFKGQFLTADQCWCYPLTVMDHASRYLLGCKGLGGPQLAPTKSAFERLFRRYGLPDRLRTDNGVPFASTSCGGLTQLSIWWLKLGIVPERIAPGRPEQNGRHERMHRTLKRATVLPPAATLAAQQRRMDAFRRFYNEERPHEALSQRTPHSCYTSSNREYPARLPEMSYPSYMETHRVSTNGLLKRRNVVMYVGHLLHGELVGLEAIEEGLWHVHFGPIVIGGIDERKPHKRYLSLKVLPM